MNYVPLKFSRGMANPEQAVENMRENCKRDLPWFVGVQQHKGEFVIVAGGPSVRKRLGAIKERARRGADIIALNGALRYLMWNGIRPHAAMFVDASPVVAGFIEDDPPAVLYFVGACCHPSVLDKLKHRKVILWHPDNGQPEQVKILRQYPEKPASLVGGGNTVGLRALFLGYILGYREFHLYGMDSSYADDGADHAYLKHEGVEPEGGEVFVRDLNKHYRVSGWMARQANEFKDLYYPLLRSKGCKIHVHGEGLLPDLFRAMRKIERKEMAL